VENETYLGLHIFRFYIKCPRCIAEIAFKVRIGSYINLTLFIYLFRRMCVYSNIKQLKMLFLDRAC